MKKGLYFVALMSMIFSLTCCKNDEPGTLGGKKQSVSVSFQIPDYYGDGWSAMKCKIVVWDPANAVVEEDVIDFDATTNKAHKDFYLAAGQEYNFLFFAYTDGTLNDGTLTGSPYVLDKDARTISIAYNGDAANGYTYDGNLESLDAFYAYKTWDIQSAFSANVTLNRITAQVNVGTMTDDYNACAADWYVPTTVAVSITNAYTTFNVADGTYANPVAVTFTGAVADLTKDFPVVVIDPNTNDETHPYTYLAMNYIFTNNENINKVDIDIYDGVAADARRHVDVSNVPVETNYRTNIYGSLLMSHGEIEIVKDPDWAGNKDTVVPDDVEVFN